MATYTCRVAWPRAIGSNLSRHIQRELKMKKVILCMAMLLASAGLARGQEPTALTVEAAMNESLELDFPFFQQFANIQIVRGGQTREGDYLFLCTGLMIWKVSSDELKALLQKEVDEKRPEPGQDDSLWRAVALSLAARLRRIGTFQQGETVTKVRFRVRLERAGTDWIATYAKVKESDSNPLYLIDKGR